MGKRARIHGSTLRARPLEEKAIDGAPDRARGAAAVRDRGVRCRSPTTFPLERAAEAYERFAAGGKLGKIVITF